MSPRLAKDIRASVKSGASIQAQVVDVFFGKASVRLLRNGQLLRKLDVIGGPVTIGQTVNVDYTTSTPTIVVTGNEAPEPVNVNAQVSYPPQKISAQSDSVSAGTIAIYHNGEKVADVEGINFVDGG